jgi:hypothetical protein
MTSNGKIAKPEVRKLARDQLAGQEDWRVREQ